MQTTGTDRLPQLQQMLEKSPDDAFLLYGIAMEHKKAGDAERALEYLERVIRADPGYCYAYYQRGLLHESSGDIDAAKRSYREGVVAAERVSDAHAKGEIQGALDLLE